MNKSTIIKVLIAGAITVLGLIAHQTYWVVNSWNINESDLNNKAIIALHKVAQSLVQASGVALPRDIVKRKTANYYIVNIEHEINPAQLRKYLKTELENLELFLDYEYAVYDCNSDQMVDVGYIKYSTDQKIEPTEELLPTHEGLNYYFGVRFLNRPGYLFGKMWLATVFSVILIVNIIFFFFAMFTILKQKRLSDLQKDFINNMTHEFKTPLSTIKISADVFLNDAIVKSDKRLLQYASIIKSQNERLNDQVEKVLQIAKIERGAFQLKKEVIDLNKLARKITKNYQANLVQNKGQLNLHLPSDTTLIEADQLHLSNVLYNLIDNAQKYCSQTPKIDLTIQKRPNQTLIEVKDNGIGIEKEHQTKVFDKFFRVPTGDIHDVKGFGLGLYYVKKIAEAHHWNVELESEHEKGTTIRIIIGT